MSMRGRKGRDLFIKNVNTTYGNMIGSKKYPIALNTTIEMMI